MSRLRLGLSPRNTDHPRKRSPHGSLGVTLHAVERAKERFFPELTEDAVRNELERLWLNAVRVGERADGALYRDPDSPLVELLVKEDPDGSKVLVTVLGNKVAYGGGRQYVTPGKRRGRDG